MSAVQTKTPFEGGGSPSLWRGCLTAAATLAVTAIALSAGAATPLTAEQRAALKPTFATVDHAPINMADLDRQAMINRTIPFWRNQVTSPVDGNTYTYTMVGKSPMAPSPSRTFIHYVPVVARIHFPDGTVLDPTQPSVCDTQPVSVADRFFNSPLFKKTSVVSNGVDVSGPNGEQLTSAFQRANFWGAVQGTNYGVDLKQKGSPTVVDVTAPANSVVYAIPVQCPSGANVTSYLGAIDINAFDGLVQSAIAPLAKPSELPVFLAYNVVQFVNKPKNCCIIGYHSATPVTNGTLTYSIGAYTDPGIFSPGFNDIYAWTHELGEWIDDPFVQGPWKGGRANNLTPAWGHTGQVGTCQNNLETGDPLTGVAYIPVTGKDGFVYSTQDLVFHDWFYRTPATGTGGMFSFRGTLTADAGAVCQ